jgi:hypothetical protein
LKELDVDLDFDTKSEKKVKERIRKRNEEIRELFSLSDLEEVIDGIYANIAHIVFNAGELKSGYPSSSLSFGCRIPMPMWAYSRPSCHHEKPSWV